jgi:hypothetical protein
VTDVYWKNSWSALAHRRGQQSMPAGPAGPAGLRRAGTRSDIHGIWPQDIHPWYGRICNGDGHVLRRQYHTIYELAVDSSAVSSAVITLNGKLVFAESDFNPNVAHLTKTVILHANNKLDVEVRSKPGSSVTVRITVVAAATTLNVHTFIFDASVPNGKGPAHGAGVQIQINGETAGVTDAMGSFSMMVTAGDLNIVGRIPAQAVGSEITIM